MNTCVFAAIPGAPCNPSCALLLKSSSGKKKCRASLYRFLTQLNEAAVPSMKAVSSRAWGRGCAVSAPPPGATGRTKYIHII